MHTDASTEAISQLTDLETGHITRITEAFLALSAAGREAVLLWMLPQALEKGRMIAPPPALTESLTGDDPHLIGVILDEFGQLSETAGEVVLNLALPQFVDD